MTVKDHLGYVLLDYNQILPIAIASIQAQQKIIDSLKVEISTIKNDLNTYLSSSRTDHTTYSTISDKNILNQNSPNPFNESTEIKFSITEQNFKNASILVFDMNGLLIKNYKIQTSGKGSIKISANELKAGMYIYSLIVNENEVDSKRMILLN